MFCSSGLMSRSAPHHEFHSTSPEQPLIWPMRSSMCALVATDGGHGRVAVDQA
jgi:hypothetical protein